MTHEIQWTYEIAGQTEIYRAKYDSYKLVIYWCGSGWWTGIVINEWGHTKQLWSKDLADAQARTYRKAVALNFAAFLGGAS